MEMFVGVGASRVRDMFQQARKNVRRGGVSGPGLATQRRLLCSPKL